MELRRSLGPLGDALRCDRDEVALDKLATDLDIDPDAAAEALRAGQDLLEGFDIRDEAWEDWLRQERARLRARLGEEARSDHREEMPLVLETGRLSPGLAGVLGLAFAGGIARMLSEFVFVQIHATAAGAVVDLPERGLALGVEVAAQGAELHAVATVCTRRSRHLLWSRSACFALAQARSFRAGDLPPLTFEAVDATLAALGRMPASDHPSERVNGLLARAIGEMFRYDVGGLRRADRLLAEAGRLRPSGTVAAWRAYLRQVLLIERMEPDRARLLDEADAFARRAVEAADVNPLTLALASAVRVMLDSDTAAGAALARDAMALGPQNPVVLAAQAGVLLRAGRAPEAWAVAREGARIAARSRLVHWLEAMAGTAALGAGHFAEAVVHFEAAHARAPQYRAPMRHLVFLYGAQGRTDSALEMARRLSRTEPDFSIERVIADPDYPATTLRQAGLVRGIA